MESKGAGVHPQARSTKGHCKSIFCDGDALRAMAYYTINRNNTKSCQWGGAALPVWRRLAIIMAVPFFILSCASQMTSSAGPQTHTGDGDSANRSDKEKNGGHRYIVHLADPALLGYSGGTSGLAPTNPEITGRPLDRGSRAVCDYRAYLSQKRARFKIKAERLLARQVVFSRQFDMTINAVVICMTPAEAFRVAALPEVGRVERDREQAPQKDTTGDPQQSSD